MRGAVRGPQHYGHRFCFGVVWCGTYCFICFLENNKQSSNNCFWKIWWPWEVPIKIISYCWSAGWLATGPLRLVGLVGWLMCLRLAGTEVCWWHWSWHPVTCLECCWSTGCQLRLDSLVVRGWILLVCWWVVAALVSNDCHCNERWHDMQLWWWIGAMWHLLLWCLLTVLLCGLLLLLYWLMC